MVLEIYVDPISQPSRALMLFVRANKIAVDEKIISIQKGEHKTEEYKKVNKFQNVPAIVHDGFHLSESVAILAYLARVFIVEDHWYPKTDLKAVGRIDQYMAWQHIGLRFPVTNYILALLAPAKLGLATLPTTEDVAVYKKKMEDALNQVEDIWLDGSKFIHGDEISIADLIAVGEIEMPRLGGYDAGEGRPKVAAYLARVKDTLSPDYDEVHESLFKAAEHFKGLLAK